MKHTPVYVLGLNLGHLATATLIKDGQIIACASEERFTRLKNQPGFPINAIKYCLNYAKISDKDLYFIAVADARVAQVFDTKEKSGLISENPLLSWLYKIELILELNSPKIRDLVYIAYRKISLFFKLFKKNTQLSRIKQTQKFLKVRNDQIIFLDHHLCHEAASLFASGFLNKYKKVLIFTADGVGDYNSATLSLYENGEIRRLQSNPSQNSLGFFYLHITEYLGFKPIEDEYKVMGLAAYVSEKKYETVYKILKKYILFDKKKLIWQFKVNEFFIKRLFPKLFAYKRFDVISAAAQRILEDYLTLWVNKNVNKYRCKNIVCGGGVFANIKVNLKIAASVNILEAFFMPSPGDESNAIGAAYYIYNKVRQNTPTLPNTQPLNDLYLGPEFSDTQIKTVIRKSNLKKMCEIRHLKNINVDVAKLLAKGAVVARFAGRMEFGARALGNRSILANPQNRDVVEFINSAIKNRDFWMPFAPTILKERVKAYLVLHNGESPFMNVAFDTTPKGQIDLAAAIHPYDKTTRPQILERDENESYYDLIKQFEKLTEIGALLNTSFNLHGEPIVATPEDAIRVFKISGLQHLAIGNFLIQKNG